MKTRFFSVFLCFFSLVSVAQDKTLTELKHQIDSLFETVEGDFGIAFTTVSDKKKKREILINAWEEFHAASTMKTPVMIEVFKQVEAGKFSLKDSLLIQNKFKSIVDGSTFKLDMGQDSDDKIYKHLGEKRSIHDLMVAMIIHSSNFATNLIIELVGAKNVTQTLREMGAKDILVLRGVEDLKAYRAGLSNTTTAYDLMLMYEELAKNQVVSPEANQKMIDILLRQQHNDIIPALLPKTTKIAHKTGSITGVRHDSGIVYLPNGKKYVLVLLSKNMEHPETGIKMLATVSKLIYDYMSEKR